MADSEIDKFYKEYGPSPLLTFISKYESFSKGAKKCNEAMREALSKDSKIPSDWIPQNMDDNLQKLLGCGKYAKENADG